MCAPLSPNWGNCNVSVGITLYYYAFNGYSSKIMFPLFLYNVNFMEVFIPNITLVSLAGGKN